MKKITAIIAVVFAFSVAGCTDASMGKFTALGDKASVKCWSGGELIFDSVSTGKVQSEAQSDGYYFRDARDGKVKEVSGNCVITYNP